MQYESYLEKMVSDGIESKHYLDELIFGLKEVSGKLDTLIALKQVELGRQQQPPQRQS